MTIHLVSLLIMFVLTIFSLITGNNLITVSVSETYEYTQILNGSISDLGLQDITANLSLDPLIQAIIWISIIGGIAIVSSITVLSSGLNEVGSHWLTLSIFYTSIWLILSALALPLISSIEVIGTLIYLSLTIAYAIGVIIHIGQR